MERDEIYRGIGFPADFSVEDWNSLIKLKFGKYFSEEKVFEKNKEILRSEIINYIRFCQKTDYAKLFDWTFDLYKDCINRDKDKIVKAIANSFYEISNTDMRWMSNVLTKPDSKKLEERDKINYYFKAIDETLEGAFKPRFKLLSKVASFKSNSIIIDNSNFDFGKLVREFPHQYLNDIDLFTKDPIFSISINQWRNIAAHKSYSINKNNITIEYGRTNIQSVTVSFDDFYKIVHWTQDVYRVIRLSQVLIILNYIEEIVTELGGTENMEIRFESSLLHIIHNMQIVGFEFVSTSKQSDTFCLNIKGKREHDLRSSLIHASQCLDQLSCAIYDDKFVRDSFQKAQVNIVNDEQQKLASATIDIAIALKMAMGEIDQKEYLSKMIFSID